jgi:hypothetical protein
LVEIRHIILDVTYNPSTLTAKPSWGGRIMSTYLPQEVRDGLEQARKKALRKASRLRVLVGEDQVPILRFGDSEFAVDLANAPSLRGFVDIYDGARHLYQALILASHEDGEQMVYEFKRMTATAEKAALDYERAEDAPVALIGRPAL